MTGTQDKKSKFCSLDNFGFLTVLSSDLETHTPFLKLLTRKLLGRGARVCRRGRISKVDFILERVALCQRKKILVTTLTIKARN